MSIQSFTYRKLLPIAPLVVVCLIPVLLYAMFSEDMAVVRVCGLVIDGLMIVGIVWLLWIILRAVFCFRYLAPKLLILFIVLSAIFDLLVLPWLSGLSFLLARRNWTYIYVAQVGIVVVIELAWIATSTRAHTLFLCLRYLLRKPLAYAAMLCVALCVDMMLVVASVMNGFLDKIEVAAKGLFGDIVVESSSQHGIPMHDELIAAVREQVPEVRAGEPFILSYGILRVPGHPNYRQAVQIAGIRLPDRVDVSSFGQGLFIQAGVDRPTFDPSIARMIDRLRAETKAIRAILERERASGSSSVESLAKHDLLAALNSAISELIATRAWLRKIEPNQERMRQLYRQLQGIRRRTGSDDNDEIDRLEEQIQALGKPPGGFPSLGRPSAYLSQDYRVILGLGIQGLSIRTQEGETIRLLPPGRQVSLSVFPLGRLGRADMTPNIKPFTIVDDCKTDVSSIDSEFVYVPFATLQKLNNMATPGRCSQIHFKVADELGRERDLRRIAAKVEEVWAKFKRSEAWQRVRNEHPVMVPDELSIQTWRQRQKRVVAPIEAQRTLVIIMFGIISLVALVLIFVIFYMIVVQKTKDIGVLKSVGAARGGLAGIFLAYGAAVGLLGSVAGTILGYNFVLDINPIHDAVGRWFGLTVWSKEWFMFEKIPNEVDPWHAVIIMLSAIGAGLLGALIPAAKAAELQPVEALRYE